MWIGERGGVWRCGFFFSFFFYNMMLRGEGVQGNMDMVFCCCIFKALLRAFVAFKKIHIWQHLAYRRKQDKKVQTMFIDFDFFWIYWDPFGHLKLIWVYQELFGDIWSYLANCTYLELSGPIWSYLDNDFFCPERFRDFFCPRRLSDFFVLKGFVINFNPRGCMVFLYQEVA